MTFGMWTSHSIVFIKLTKTRGRLQFVHHPSLQFICFGGCWQFQFPVSLWNDQIRNRKQDKPTQIYFEGWQTNLAVCLWWTRWIPVRGAPSTLHSTSSNNSLFVAIYTQRTPSTFVVVAHSLSPTSCTAECFTMHLNFSNCVKEIKNREWNYVYVCIQVHYNSVCQFISCTLNDAAAATANSTTITIQASTVSSLRTEQRDDCNWSHQAS